MTGSINVKSGLTRLFWNLYKSGRYNTWRTKMILLLAWPSTILQKRNIMRNFSWYLAWPFTILQNDNIMIWDFLRLTAPAAMPGHLGAVSLKKSHDIVILSFCNIVKGQAKCLRQTTVWDMLKKWHATVQYFQNSRHS